jgi:DNA-binding NtrC family response regulator
MAAILVVDDDVALRSLAQVILQPRGYRVLVADGGPQALEVAQAEPGPIDLLVTDLLMPRMNGADLGRHLRALHPEMRVLYITALAVARLAVHTVNEIRLDPDVPILVKPFSIEALEQQVRAVLERAPSPGPAPDVPYRRPGLLTPSGGFQP